MFNLKFFSGDTSVCRYQRHENGNSLTAIYRGDRLRETRFSAPRSHGNCASRTAIASAAVSAGVARGGTGWGSAARRARRARWLRAWALPPRAPRRRSCCGVLLKRIWEWLFMLSPANTFIRSVREHKQVKSGSPTQIHAMEKRCPGKTPDTPKEGYLWRLLERPCGQPSHRTGCFLGPELCGVKHQRNASHRGTSVKRLCIIPHSA
jgi:hypothetical protein